MSFPEIAKDDLYVGTAHAARRFIVQAHISGKAVELAASVEDFRWK
jgi:hypothetical protein